MMTTQQIIEKKLHDNFSPLNLEVIDESHNHNVAQGAESHFKVVIVSDTFKGAKLIERHRRINKVLAEELSDGIHALALHTLTPDEWFNHGGTVPDSPECLGGSKKA